MTEEDGPWIKRTRFLTQALVLSGALNICLVATFLYSVLKDKHEILSVSQKEVNHNAITPVRTNEELLQAYSFLPFSELLLRLDNLEPIEEGLSKRDIALACLVAFHHFPLEKSLGGWTPQKRQISMRNMEGQEAISVNVFPGLSDFQFQAIAQFAKTEKWPLSSQGLFYELKRQEGNHDLSLLETFYLTPEFHLVSTLFFKTGLPLTKAEIITLLTSGEWSLLSDWMNQQNILSDISVEARRAFLLSYLDRNSPIAAELLFKSENEFCLKKLSDPQMLFLLSVLKAKEISCESFVRELIASPRTDAVRDFAGSLYPTFIAKQPEPTPVQEEPKVIQTALPVEKKKIIHTVEAGENLWKIARKYHVTADAIMHHNHLETDKVKPGRKLEIPESKK